MKTRSNYQTATDPELFVLLKTDNKAAFLEIYQRCRMPLYLYARKIVEDKKDALPFELLRDLF